MASNAPEHGGLPDGPGFLHDRVAEAVRTQIRHGTLRPGDRAPSLRRLRQRFAVSMATATRAYERLEQGGWLEARPQSGFYVRVPRGQHLASPHAGRPPANPERVDTATLTRQLVTDQADTPDAVTLSLALPDERVLPTRAVERSLARVARHSVSASLRYRFPPGVERLRRPIALRTADAGVTVHPDDVVITAGCAEALAIALHACVPPGSTVAVESPTFFNILVLLQTQGLRALELPTDPQTGLDTQVLADQLATGAVDAVLVIPNFSNPLGACMPDAAKRHLAELASHFDVPVIEDDIYGELYFGARRPPLVRAFDPSGHVLTAASLSKTVATGLRVGWLLPGRYREAALTAKHAVSVATATLPAARPRRFPRTRRFRPPPAAAAARLSGAGPTHA